MAVGGLYLSVMLLPVKREVKIRRRRSPGVLFCRPDAFGLLTCEFRRQYFGFRQTGSGYLSTGSSFARPDVASSGPDTASPIMPSVKFSQLFCFASVSITALLSI